MNGDAFRTFRRGLAGQCTACGQPLFRRRPGMQSFDVPPPVVATGPVSMRLTEPERRAMAPKLRVRAVRDPHTGRPMPGLWRWDLGHGLQQLSGLHPTHREALAVGLAAAESRTLLERVNR